MNDADLLRSYVDQYHLTITGVSFWTPYWRDELPSTENAKPRTGPFKGKATPRQLKDYFYEHKDDVIITTSDELGYRQAFRDLCLGVDCSGFAFYVLDNLVQAKTGRPLADCIYKPRTALLEDFDNPVYVHPPHITRELLEGLPEWVSLQEIQRFWGNEPVRLAGVKLMTTDAATVPVEINDVRPGDMIYFTHASGIDHIVIVVEVDGEVLTYAHSGRPHEKELGGVEYGKIILKEPRQSMQSQDWDRDDILEVHFDESPLRRLKVLDG